MDIRKQSIISSIVIYIGFAIGLLNTYFFTKEGLFTTQEYGLTSIFINVATLITSLSAVGMPSYIVKFFPYYNDHLEPKKNDMITWALLITLIGFSVVMIFGIVFKDLVYRKYATNSPLFIQYYYWVFPMGFGLTIYSLLESYAWTIRKPILTNFLREVEWRFVTTIFIVLFIYNIVPDFSVFIKLYAFTYPIIAITLFGYLLFSKKINFTFRVSNVTRRLKAIIIKFCSFIYASSLIFTISQVFDSILIASLLPNGLAKAGIFGLAQILTGVIQAPQRGIISASIPHLSQAWKDRDIKKIERIYKRSSINQLVFSIFLLVLITINYKDAVQYLNLKPEFLLGFNAFILLGMTKVIDMGTGVNAQIIGTSNYWKFELASGIVLLFFMLPLNYILTKQLDLLGPALANLISISIYNLIRIIFLWKKFKLFPFTKESLFTVLLGLIVYLAAHLFFKDIHGFWGLATRTLFISIVYVSAVITLKLTPDIAQVMETIKKRFVK